VERIASLANDLALVLAVPGVRVEAPIPGTGLIGIEVPNTGTAVVSLREVIESPALQRLKVKSKLAIALGKGAGGEPVVADLTKMPHLLIAGATGSGKTVCLNSIITCLLMHATPSEMRLILIDPKRVEMLAFNYVPHLITPVVVDIKEVIETLRRLSREMENRYRKFAAVGVRNIEGYNQRVTESLPYIVVIIDELADLMLSSAEAIEPLICRLAQLSRATGIHLVVATQRPSVDVVTGLIKANFPSRISFAVASAVDSRTILDAIGAEKLLGRGDMLFLPSDAAKPKRLRGCFVSDQEIERMVNFWRQRTETQRGKATDNIAQSFASLEAREIIDEPLLEQARQLAREHGHISTSFLQRRLRIGYPRAARLMDLLEQEGLISTKDEESKLGD
jgi:S-DNA-T family DNA segregation ATPase FtsK/SpoIIIE